jgi:hypothetical protein
MQDHILCDKEFKPIFLNDKELSHRDYNQSTEIGEIIYLINVKHVVTKWLLDVPNVLWWCNNPSIASLPPKFKQNPRN